jgi:hypothetical protein
MSADPDPFDDFKEQQKSAAPPPSPLPPEMQEELATTQVNVEMAQARVDQQNSTYQQRNVQEKNRAASETAGVTNQTEESDDGASAGKCQGHLLSAPGGRNNTTQNGRA